MPQFSCQPARLLRVVRAEVGALVSARLSEVERVLGGGVVRRLGALLGEVLAELGVGDFCCLQIEHAPQGDRVQYFVGPTAGLAAGGAHGEVGLGRCGRVEQG